MNRIDKIIRENIKKLLKESNDIQMSNDDTTVDVVNSLNNYSNALHSQIEIFDKNVNKIKQDINNIDNFLNTLKLNLSNPVVDVYNGNLYIKFDILNSENWSDEEFNNYENIIYQKLESFKSSLRYDSLIEIELLDDDVRVLYVSVEVMHNKEINNVFDTLERETELLKNNIR